MMNKKKTIEIIVDKKLERSPFNNTGRYYKLYLPEDTYLNANQYKLVDLISETFLKHETLDIISEFVVTISKHKKVVIKLLNKTKYYSYNFPKNMEIARLYVFISPREKIQTVYRLEHDRLSFNRAGNYNR